MTTSVPTSTTHRLAVDVWLDVACPWCALGERRLESVLAALPFRDSVDIRFRSFQLDPNAPQQSDITQTEYLERRGMPTERIEAARKHLNEAGAELDFHFDYARAIPSNTHTAHRLIQAAAEHGVQQQVVDALFSAYFEQGRDVGDFADLKRVVTEAGLPAAAADAVIADPELFRDAVATDIADAAKLGITGVPYTVIDGRYGISGAQPAEALTSALTQVYEELNPAPQVISLPGIGNVGETCGPNGCTI